MSGHNYKEQEPVLQLSAQPSHDLVRAGDVHVHILLLAPSFGAKVLVMVRVPEWLYFSLDFTTTTTTTTTNSGAVNGLPRLY